MKFNFDPEKSRLNKAKHKIDFIEAQALWLSSPVKVPARSDGEERFIVIGVIGDEHWSAIITPRGAETRIISVRRSRAIERKLYEQSR